MEIVLIWETFLNNQNRAQLNQKVRGLKYTSNPSIPLQFGKMGQT
jgi:hypothetical protein